MNLSEAVRVLVLGDGRRFPVLPRETLHMLFPNDSDRAIASGLTMLLGVGLLERIARGVYLNRAAPGTTERCMGWMIEALRPGHLNYLSYESALANAGSLSQQPYWYTLATTGNTGEYSTRYGNIAFRHTNRRRAEIYPNTVVDEQGGYLVAHPTLALDDLRRAKPALVASVDKIAHEEVVGEWGPYHAG